MSEMSQKESALNIADDVKQKADDSVAVLTDAISKIDNLNSSIG